MSVFGGHPRIFVARRGAEVVALAPFMRLGSAVPTYVGVGQEIADYGGVLLAADPSKSADALLAAVESRLLSAPALVSFGRIPPQTVLFERLTERYRNHDRLKLSTFQLDTYPYLDLEATPKTRVERLKKRNDVKRRLRRLQERHSVEFEYDSSHDPGAIEDFFRLHDLRWGAKATRANGPFVHGHGREFLRRAVAAMSPSGQLRLSFVRIDGERVVGRFGFELDGTYYGAKSAFDPRLASAGPGHLAVAYLLDTAADRGLKRFDFMRGEGAHKSAWADASVQVPNFWLHHRSGLGLIERQVSRTRLALRYRRPGLFIGPQPRTRTMAS
jgi:CelD/BcsL family acetyltransferase involved in cellulose biosynthesis